MGLEPLFFRVCFTVQKVPWSRRYLAYIFICPVSSGYTHIVYSPKQFFSLIAVCVLCTGITYLPRYYHPFFLSPFTNQSLQPFYHLCHWSSLTPIHSIGHHFLSPWMVSHHSFICPQATSKACTESVTWHGSESDLVPCVLSVPSCSAVANCFSPQTFWWRCVSQVSFFSMEFQHLSLLGSQISCFSSHFD